MSVKTGVIIAAGGSSNRMNGIDKLFALIDGIPVIARSCLAFQENESFSEIVVSVKKESVEMTKRLLNEFGITKLKAVVSGGDTRFVSVKNAFEALSDCDYVAIHDGARPLASQELLNRCVAAAIECGCALPAVISTDTLKKAENGQVVSTVDRSNIYRAQTPQIFKKEAYAEALSSCADFAYTDDCSILENVGYRVCICEGETANIKITEPSDLSYAEFLLKGNTPMMRIGHGYDVHKLVEGRKLIVCGVDIPYEKGLLGHSDADVATHAIMDSLLGATALGDIGKLFPDTDSEYAGISSLILLEKVTEIVNSNGYTIGNIDLTIVAQRPKFSPYTENMRSNIASACGIPLSSVSIKATTEEGLGFTGCGEGISATAVSSVISR